MDNKLNTLGLAFRAKKIILGEDILKSINKVKLIFIANDISVKSKERILKKCVYYNIDYVETFNSTELSNALGKNNIKLIGVIDEGFKNSLLNK